MQIGCCENIESNFHIACRSEVPKGDSVRGFIVRSRRLVLRHVSQHGAQQGRRLVSELICILILMDNS